MKNESYVLASYAITTITLLGIIFWVMLDGRARKRELKELEEAGIRRRSAAQDTENSKDGPTSP